ncbi:9520_t:CDS:1, partial [Funneliformis mosseae]
MCQQGMEFSISSSLNSFKSLGKTAAAILQLYQNVHCLIYFGSHPAQLNLREKIMDMISVFYPN